MNVKAIIANQRLTPSEKKIVAACNAKLELLTDLGDRYRPREEAILHGRKSGLQDSQDSAGEDFIADPSREKFEKFLEALAQSALVESNRALMSDIGRRAFQAAQGALAPVAEGVLSRAAAEIQHVADERRAAAEAAGLLAEHDARVAAALAELDHERAAAREWPGPGAWLASHGLA